MSIWERQPGGLPLSERPDEGSSFGLRGWGESVCLLELRVAG